MTKMENIIEMSGTVMQDIAMAHVLHLDGLACVDVDISMPHIHERQVNGTKSGKIDLAVRRIVYAGVPALTFDHDRAMTRERRSKRWRVKIECYTPMRVDLQPQFIFRDDRRHRTNLSVTAYFHRIYRTNVHTHDELAEPRA